MMMAMSSIFVSQFEGKDHGRELGAAVPQELCAGGVACASEPSAEACEQLDRVAQVFGRGEAARAGESGEHAQFDVGEQHLGGQLGHLTTRARDPIGPAFALWGRAATGHFESEVDGEWRHLLGGVMLTHSTGEGAYRPNTEAGKDAGRVESDLTGLYPYARADLNRRVSAWGLAGAAGGNIALKREGGRTMETGLSMTTGVSMHAMTRNVPPHTPQCSMSMRKTRLSRCIQLMGARRNAWGSRAE